MFNLFLNCKYGPSLTCPKLLSQCDDAFYLVKHFIGRRRSQALYHWATAHAELWQKVAGQLGPWVNSALGQLGLSQLGPVFSERSGAYIYCIWCVLYMYTLSELWLKLIAVLNLMKVFTRFQGNKNKRLKNSLYFLSVSLTVVKSDPLSETRLIDQQYR